MEGGKRFGVRDGAEHKRKTRVLSKHSLDHPGLTQPSPGHRQQALVRLTRRTVKFIRRLKNHLEQPRERPAAIARPVEVQLRL
jgi:hypothetical protein